MIIFGEILFLSMSRSFLGEKERRGILYGGSRIEYEEIKGCSELYGLGIWREEGR